MDAKIQEMHNRAVELHRQRVGIMTDGAREVIRTIMMVLVPEIVKNERQEPKQNGEAPPKRKRGRPRKNLEQVEA